MSDSNSSKTTFSNYAIWHAGFRPFFILAMVSGAILPLLWAALFAGHPLLRFSELTTLQWHAHEMFFGFGWAVLGGFLLTASKNWVHVRGIYGVNLIILTALWLIERFAIVYYDQLHFGTRLILLNAFLVYIISYILWTLIKFRKQDTFKDNYFFIISLPLFLISKNFLLSSEYYIHGWSMTLGLFRLAFVLMIERTLTQFMRNAMKVDLFRSNTFEFALKLLTLTTVFQSFFPLNISGLLLLITAILLMIRFLLWKPLKGFKNFGIGVSYAGFLGLTLHYFLEAFKHLGSSQFIGSISLHTFSFLCMGLIIPGMFIRISQGHTGRKLLFTKSDQIAFYSIGIGAFFRLITTQAMPQYYQIWITTAALCWSISFTLIGIRLIPFLVKPRVDGKIH